MAKHADNPTATWPDKEEQRRYQAEDMMRQTMMNHPGYKKAVDQMMTEMAGMEKKGMRILSASLMDGKGAATDDSKKKQIKKRADHLVRS